MIHLEQRLLPGPHHRSSVFNTGNRIQKVDIPVFTSQSLVQLVSNHSELDDSQMGPPLLALIIVLDFPAFYFFEGKLKGGTTSPPLLMQRVIDICTQRKWQRSKNMSIHYLIHSHTHTLRSEVTECCCYLFRLLMMKLFTCYCCHCERKISHHQQHQ